MKRNAEAQPSPADHSHHQEKKQSLLDLYGLGWKTKKRIWSDPIQQDREWVTRTIGGITIKFPFKPYSSQMALLTAAFAWRINERAKLKEAKRALKKDEFADVEDENFVQIQGQQKKANENANDISELPKIYYTSRTQKQIKQVIKEMKMNTPYRPKMAVLGSRDYLCVNPTIAALEGKNEACNDLCKNNQCSYRAGTEKLTRDPLFTDTSTGGHVWDIEDIVASGKEFVLFTTYPNRQIGCAFFAARALAKNADIVFCPYNYITDPGIRSAMEIDLTDAIIIFDEAHNLEGCCADAGSCRFSEEDLASASNDLKSICNKMSSSGPHRNLMHYETLNQLVFNIYDFVNNYTAPFPKKEYDKESRLWSGEACIQTLLALDITKASYPGFDFSLQSIVEDKRMVDPRKETLSVRDNTLQLLRSVMGVLKFLLNGHENDYRMVMTSAQITEQPRRRGAPNWITNSPNQVSGNKKTLEFWLLKPGVIFSEISDLSRCVILTSGTLCPMQSFSGELGCDFEIKLEAQHVIDTKQVFVAHVPNAPSGYQMLGTFKHTSTTQYQDALAACVLTFLQKIPEGILLFLPSYNWIENFIKRWKLSGSYDQMSALKRIFIEPRNNRGGVFDDMMVEYAQAVKEPKGALFICVHRGKLSEGIDFSDELARAVLVAGIPFPSTKDLKVIEKKHYNDTYHRQGKLLSGNEWYEVQAYRALNQALGRCIRHRNDWGCIFLLDSRFGDKRAVGSISRWVRQNIRTYRDQSGFVEMESDLVEFVKCQRDRMELELVAAAAVQPLPESSVLSPPPDQDLIELNSAGSELVENDIEMENNSSPAYSDCNIGTNNDCTLRPLDYSPALFASPVINHLKTPATTKSRMIDLSTFKYTPKDSSSHISSLLMVQTPEKTSVENKTPIKKPPSFKCSACHTIIYHARSSSLIKLEKAYPSILLECDSLSFYNVAPRLQQDRVSPADSFDAVVYQPDDLVYKKIMCASCCIPIGVEVVAACCTTATKLIGSSWLGAQNVQIVDADDGNDLSSKTPTITIIKKE